MYLLETPVQCRFVSKANTYVVHTWDTAEHQIFCLCFSLSVSARLSMLLQNIMIRCVLLDGRILVFLCWKSLPWKLLGMQTMTSQCECINPLLWLQLLIREDSPLVRLTVSWQKGKVNTTTAKGAVKTPSANEKIKTDNKVILENLMCSCSKLLQVTSHYYIQLFVSSL